MLRMAYEASRSFLAVLLSLMGSVGAGREIARLATRAEENSIVSKGQMIAAADRWGRAFEGGGL